MTDTAGNAPLPVEPPDAPAYHPDAWHSPTMDLPGTIPIGGSRAEAAADQIARVAAQKESGERLGSKDDIRRLCRVSVGTINEAIKLALDRGVITSRPGPGGGIFALDPSPLSRMNGWFRSAAQSDSSLVESIEIRDALAPLLVAEVLAQFTDADQEALERRLVDLRRARDADDVSGFVWAAWGVHEYFAGLGRSKLLDSLYLSIMDVGTSHLRTRLQVDDAADIQVHLDGLAEVVEDLVHALSERDADKAVDALRRTDPTMILRPRRTSAE